MDFTLSAYKQLLLTLQSQGFYFTFEEVIQKPLNNKVIVLGHDVDKLPGNALKMAVMEHELGINASYYFRVIPQTFKPEIINEILGMEHEIEYHYENLSEISKGEIGKRKQNRENRNEEKGKGKGEIEISNEEIGIRKEGEGKIRLRLRKR